MDKKEKLRREFRSLRERGFVDARIPDPEHNGNYDYNIESPVEYIKGHIEESCLREFPYLIKRAKLAPNSKILDYGCGWARLGYAASNFLNAEGRYVGFDINEFAIAENKKCYANYKNFSFTHLPVDVKENYIYMSDNYTPLSQVKEKTSTINAAQVSLPEDYRNYFDVIYSYSVFTHMWKEAIANILRQQAKVINYNGICVNTWLVVDDFTRYILKCGLADRQLPYVVNGALTTSMDNPLICVAYRIQDVHEIYLSAGHQILDIEFGTWAGRNNHTSYQDIVVSRPFKKD